MAAYPAALAALHNERAAAAALSDPNFPDMHRVAPGLYLGSQRAAGVLFPFEERDAVAAPVLRAVALASLRAAGICSIVCCSSADARVFATEGISYECALLSDGSDADISESTPAFADLLRHAVRLFSDTRSRGESMLVHCASGAHRSASVVCGILMESQAAPLAAVLPAVLAARPFARPTFWRHLVGEVEPRVCTAGAGSLRGPSAAGHEEPAHLGGGALAVGDSEAAAGSLRAPSVVMMVGDSTLDNVVWVEHIPRARSVSSHLTEALLARSPDADPSFVAVHNLACDGFTSVEVLNGAAPRISAAARERAGDPFPNAPGALFRPLDHVEAIAAAAAARGAGAYAVLSVGGNDVHEVLGAVHEIPRRIAAFQEAYPRVLERLMLATGGRVVIVLCYRPALDEPGVLGVYGAIERMPGPGSGADKLSALMAQVYAPVLALARSHGLPVVDLASSFDPADAGLYRCHIEPSDRGGARVARLVAHAIAEFPWASAARGSTILSQWGVDGGPISAQANDAAHPWRPRGGPRA